MQKKLVLCSRGGGVKSATTIGALKAFKEANIEISSYSGSSIGAIVTTLAAIDTPAEQILTLFQKFVVEYSEANRLHGGKGSSIIEKSINEQCNNIRFKDVEKPLYIVANSGGLWRTEAFIFSKETTPNITLGEACRASCSFPIFYEHFRCRINDEDVKFFDGGMAMNPYVPPLKKDEISVVVSFKKNKTNLKSRYVQSWMVPEKSANILIKPYVGRMGIFGTPDDIEMCMRLGYYEALRHVETLKKEY